MRWISRLFGACQGQSVSHDGIRTFLGDEVTAIADGAAGHALGDPHRWFRTTSRAGTTYKRYRSGCSALNQSHDQHNHRDHKNEVNQGSPNMADQSEQPEHQQNNKYCPKHEIRQIISEPLYTSNSRDSGRMDWFVYQTGTVKPCRLSRNA